MKHIWIFALLTSLFLVACVSASVPKEDVLTLAVTDGTAIKFYTLSDLQALRQVQVEEKGVIYLGVPILDLLVNADYDPATVVAVQALTSDGFTAVYDQVLIMKSDTLLAYALLDGSLGEDEGPFRMVVPGQTGKLNPRNVVELLVTHP